MTFEAIESFGIVGFGHFIGKRGMDSGTHFGGGGVGEGDDEHSIDVAIAAEDHLNDALDEHGGLAGAGGGADEQIFAAGVNGFGLIGGPVGHGINDLSDGSRGRRR